MHTTPTQIETNDKLIVNRAPGILAAELYSQTKAIPKWIVAAFAVGLVTGMILTLIVIG